MKVAMRRPQRERHCPARNAYTESTPQNNGDPTNRSSGRVQAQVARCVAARDAQWLRRQHRTPCKRPCYRRSCNDFIIRGLIYNCATYAPPGHKLCLRLSFPCSCLNRALRAAKTLPNAIHSRLLRTNCICPVLWLPRDRWQCTRERLTGTDAEESLFRSEAG